MSWILEQHEGSVQVGRDGEVTATRVFKIDTGNPANRPEWGIDGIDIQRYDAHPSDARLKAIEANSVPDSDCLGVFVVSYVYSNRPLDVGTTGDGTGDPGGSDPVVQPNPILRTPTCSWSTNSRMVPFEEDNDDPSKAVTNSAGQVFEGLEVEAITAVTSITFNVAGGKDIASKALAFVNTVNSAPFAPIPAHGPYTAGTLRCNAWNGTLQYEPSGGWYTQCTVEFEFMRGGWHRDIIDAGFYQRVLKDGNYVEERVMDPTSGQPVDAPVKLDGNGKRLEPGTTTGLPAAFDSTVGPYWVKNDGTNDVTVYKRFFPYPWVSWVNIFA